MIYIFTKMIERLMNKLPNAIFLFKPYYAKMIQKEIQLAKIGDNDKVLFVGCGPLPISAILLQENTNAQVDTIDIDQKMARSAQKYLCRCKKEHLVSVFHKKIQDVSLVEYSVIMIAVQVEQKEEMLEYLLSRCSSGTRILFRESSKTLYKNSIINECVLCSNRRVKRICLLTI